MALIPAIWNQSAEANTYTVTSIADTDDEMLEEIDPQPGELRDEIDAANNHAGADIIVFDLDTGDENIVFSPFGDEVLISDDLTITGPGAANLFIESGADDFSAFIVADNVSVTVTGLKIAGCDALVLCQSLILG